MNKNLFFFFLLPWSLLLSQADDSWKLYDDSKLARVDISIDTARLHWIYDHVESDSEHVAAIRFRNAWFDETVDSVGFRLRGNTSRNAQKKSFKISFNSFQKGKQFHSIEKLNLNGEHNDPSIIRSKLSFELFHDIGYPASRASHALVYINGVYYGLYISVEHIDEEFLKKNFIDHNGNLWKCLYPADLKYLGGTPAPYKAVMNSSTTPAYELTTNEAVDDFSRFVHLVDVLNNTPSAVLPDSLEQYLSVYRILQYFAMNTLVGSWDDYRSLMNNYYLYHIPSEDKFTLIPYDYDNTFGIDWFGINWANANPYTFPKVSSGARPLAENILANAQYRDLFTHFIRFYADKVFQLPLWESRIDRIKDSITTAAQQDTYRTLDWGFTVSDFNNSYSALSYSNQHVKFGLKQFVNARITSLPAQLSMQNAPPIAYLLEVSPKYPGPADSIRVTASCFGTAGIKDVRLQCTVAGSSTDISATMNYTPLVPTKHIEEADRWSGVLPPLGAGVVGTLQVILEDSLGRIQTYPRGKKTIIKTSAVANTSVLINEFLADNSTIADPAGQYDDWVELYNPTSAPVLLSNKYLTDKAGNFTKWKFKQPGLSLAPGQYLVVWCDEDTAQQGIHTNFKLSAGGEFLALIDTDGVTVLDSLSFGPQQPNISFGRAPGDIDHWGFMIPTPGLQNSASTGVAEGYTIPFSFTLGAFPNPFNPTTTITFTLAQDGFTTLKIYDLLGREMATLISQNLNAGEEHRVLFNASKLSSGMYFYRLEAGGTSLVKKLMLMK